MADSYELFLRQFQRGALDAVPTSGTFQIGDFIFNSSVAAGGPLGWICTTGGTPGTWVPVAPVGASAPTTLAAAGAVAPTSSVVDINSGGFNITLTAPTAVQNGARIAFVNDTASACTFVAGSGTTLIGNATLAANSSAQIQSLYPLVYRVA